MGLVTEKLTTDDSSLRIPFGSMTFKDVKFRDPENTLFSLMCSVGKDKTSLCLIIKSGEKSSDLVMLDFPEDVPQTLIPDEQPGTMREIVALLQEEKSKVESVGDILDNAITARLVEASQLRIEHQGANVMFVLLIESGGEYHSFHCFASFGKLDAFLEPQPQTRSIWDV